MQNEHHHTLHCLLVLSGNQWPIMTNAQRQSDEPTWFVCTAVCKIYLGVEKACREEHKFLLLFKEIVDTIFHEETEDSKL